LKGNRRFGGACRLNYQGRRTGEIRNQNEADLIYPGFLLGLLFKLEGEGEMFLQQFG
jgi:hypothetical protein